MKKDYKSILIVLVIIMLFDLSENTCGAAVVMPDQIDPSHKINTITEESLCLISSKLGKRTHAPQILRSPRNPDFKLLYEGNGTIIADFINLPGNVKEVPFLTISGSHGIYGKIFETPILNYYENVIKPLVKRGFRSKIIVLDECLTLSILPAFIPLLTDDGMIIAQATDSAGAVITEMIANLGKLDLSILKNEVLNGVGDLNKINDNLLLNVFMSHYETFEQPKALTAFKDTLGKQNCNFLKANWNNKLEIDKIRTMLINAGIKNVSSNYVIYKKKPNEVFYDTYLEEGWGNFFQRSSNEFLSESLQKCINVAKDIELNIFGTDKIKFTPVENFNEFVNQNYDINVLKIKQRIVPVYFLKLIRAHYRPTHRIYGKGGDVTNGVRRYFPGGDRCVGNPSSIRITADNETTGLDTSPRHGKKLEIWWEDIEGEQMITIDEYKSATITARSLQKKLPKK